MQKMGVKMLRKKYRSYSKTPLKCGKYPTFPVSAGFSNVFLHR